MTIIKSLLAVVILIGLLTGLIAGDRYGSYVVLVGLVTSPITIPFLIRMLGKAFSELHNDITNSR